MYLFAIKSIAVHYSFRNYLCNKTLRNRNSNKYRYFETIYGTCYVS